MIKNFLTYVKEDLDHSDIDPYGEEDWDTEKYKLGDYITVVNMPYPPHWLHNTRKRTFKLTGYPTMFAGGRLMWCTDGVYAKYTGNGIPESCFRKATEEEIEEAYGED